MKYGWGRQEVWDLYCKKWKVDVSNRDRKNIYICVEMKASQTALVC